MDVETIYADPANALEIAFACDALFEQYDETDISSHANDAMYENLYPNVA